MKGNWKVNVVKDFVELFNNLYALIIHLKLFQSILESQQYLMILGPHVIIYEKAKIHNFAKTAVIGP